MCARSTARAARPSPSGRRRPARSPSSATSTPGTSAPIPMRTLGSTGVWELFVPEAEPGHGLQVRDPRRRRRRAAEGRPLGRARRAAAAHRARSIFESALCVARRRLARAARGRASRTARPMSVYEVHLGSWRAQHARGQPLADLHRARRRARRLRARPQLHARRADAGDGAPVHGLVGLPGHGLLRPDRALRLARRVPRLRRPPARARPRRDPRLGAGALPARRVRARALRRHRALRARRPAARRAPRLGHARLQLRPHRGAQLPRRQRALLAPAVPRRRHPRRCRGLDALPRLLAQGGGVDPERVRRPREPRGDRRSSSSSTRSCTAASPARSWPPRSRPPGRASRARPTSAASASASSGTWAGCTTRSSTSGATPPTASHHHGELTFSLMYAFTENFVLPLSHDEVVHGKGSLLDKMPGDRWQQLANLRALYAYMWAHPGKKLLFMGGEFAQEQRVEPRRSLDWHLARAARPQGRADARRRPQRRLPRRARAVGARLASPAGFEWLELNDAAANVIAFARFSADDERALVCVCNFSPVVAAGLSRRAAASRALARGAEHGRRRLRRLGRRQPGAVEADETSLARPALVGRAAAAAARRGLAGARAQRLGRSAIWSDWSTGPA